MKQYLEIGKIVNVHGLRGDVKVVPWCDEPEFLCEFDTLYLGKTQKPVNVTAARLQKGNVLLHLEGVDTVEAAEQLRNQVLYMDRDEVELEEGVYFIQDLIGLEVLDADTGKSYGSWIHFDYVPGTPDVRSGSAGTTGRLCVIGSGIHEDALTELFHAE